MKIKKITLENEYRQQSQLAKIRIADRKQHKMYGKQTDKFCRLHSTRRMLRGKHKLQKFQ
jgi:hypothetical protein